MKLKKLDRSDPLAIACRNLPERESLLTISRRDSESFVLQQYVRFLAIKCKPGRRKKLAKFFNCLSRCMPRPIAVFFYEELSELCFSNREFSDFTTRALTEAKKSLRALVEKAADETKIRIDEPKRVHQAFEYIVKEIHPCASARVYLEGSNSERCGRSPKSDVDLMLVHADPADRMELQKTINAIHMLSVRWIDAYLISKPALKRVLPVYVGSVIVNTMGLRSGMRRPRCGFTYDEASFFLSQFKLLSKYMTDGDPEIPLRRLVKQVCYYEVIKSKDVAKSLENVSYKNFDRRSVLGKCLIQNGFRRTEKFRMLQKQELIRLWLKALKYLEEFEDSKPLEPIDPWFGKLLPNESWKDLYRRRMEEVLFGQETSR